MLAIIIRAAGGGKGKKERHASAWTIASTSYTQPPQVPPLTRCSAAHSRVSSGRSGSGARSGRGGRAARTRAPSSGPKPRRPSPTRSTVPSSRLRSMTISNHVAVAHLADRAAGQRLRADVADARPRRDAGKAGVGQHRDVLAEVEVLQGRCDLVNLLHAGAHRPAADQHQHVAGLDAVRAAALDRRDRPPSRW